MAIPQNVKPASIGLRLSAYVMSGDRIPEQQLTFKNFNLVQPAVRPGSAAPGLFRRWRRPKPRLLPAGIAGEIMKYVDACPFADPDAAARKLVRSGT